MALPSNVDRVVVRGRWLDEITGAGVANATVTFEPVALTGQGTTPALRDLTAFAWIKTRTVTAPVAASGYFAALVLSSDDPDLDPYGGRRVTFSGEAPRVIAIPHDAPVVRVDAEMADAIPALTIGDQVRAIWLVEAESLDTAPVPVTGYLDAEQTRSTIASGVAAGIAGHDGDAAAHPALRALIARTVAAVTRPAGYDALSTKPDGPLSGVDGVARTTDDGTLWYSTGTAPAYVAAGLIGHAPGFTGSGSWYALRRLLSGARPLRLRGRFRFDTSDAIGSSVAFGFFDATSPTASPFHCSITPSYVRLSTFVAPGISTEQVVRPTGFGEDQPRFPRQLPCDSTTWVTVEVLLDIAASVGYLLIALRGELYVLRFENDRIATIDARYAFVQSFAVAGSDNLGRWDGDSIALDSVPASERSPAWTDLVAASRAQPRGGAGPVTARPAPRMRPGAVWAVPEQALALTAAIPAPRTDPGCATTAGSATVTDPAITAADAGRLVTGPGVPATTYVRDVTGSGSTAQFTLSSSPTTTTPVTATATGSGVSLAFSTDRVTAASPVRPGSQLVIDTGAAREVRTVATPSGSGTAFTLPLTAPLAAAHAAGAAFVAPARSAVSFGDAWREAGVLVGNRIPAGIATCLEDVGGLQPTSGARVTVRAPNTRFRSARVHRVTQTGTGLLLIYTPTLYPIEPGEPFAALTGQILGSVARGCFMALRYLNASGAQVGTDTPGAAQVIATSGQPTEMPPAVAVAPPTATHAQWIIYINDTAAGDVFWLTEIGLVIVHGVPGGYAQ